MWYSYNYGSVHFVAFDTETDYSGAPEETHGDSGLLPAGGFAPAGTQLAWLEADLAKVCLHRAVLCYHWRAVCCCGVRVCAAVRTG